MVTGNPWIDAETLSGPGSPVDPPAAGNKRQERMRMKRLLLIPIVCLIVMVPGICPAAGGARVETLSRSTLSWDGNPLPEYPRGRPEITVLRITIPPGTVLPMHRHPVINAGVMTRGELTVTTTSGNVLHLSEGQSLIEVVDTWHFGKNEGTTPAEIIVFYAGVEGEPVTLKQE